MSRLLLYTDLSPSRPWLFSTVHANSDLLAEHNIELGPLNSNACELVPSHSTFWRIVPEGGTVPPRLARLLEEVVRKLDSGHDVLLLSWTPYILAHQSIACLLQKYLNLARHEVKTLFVLGRPACVLEQRYREAKKFPPAKKRMDHVKRFNSLPSLIKHAHHTWGTDKVTLLADTADSPVTYPQEHLSEQLFFWLGCPQPRPLKHLPRHPLFFASLTARRLNQALEVRENAWPRLDEGMFMDSLLSLDRQWGTEPVSPKNIREALIRNGANTLRELEEMLALQAHALDCPDWLAEQPETDMDTPLSADRLQNFAAALPPEIRKPVRQRFANDASLLTPDQKALDKALSAVTPTGKMDIGEPVPPVELTVLTMTYNHEKYIAECMDSVLAQQTSFPVRHIVLDHHSTDGTAEIVASYAARHPSIQPVLLSRHRPSENVMGLFLRCRTKYAALCDGDDYFIDPLKLQKQIDFLENHSRCTLCFHPVAVVFEDGQQPGVFPSSDGLPRGIHEEYYLADLFKGNMIQTNSVVYLWRFQEGLPDWFRPDLCPGDWYWHLLHAETGKIGFLPEVMSVYRRHENALYRNSFVDEVAHRRTHGMAELATYQAVNEHFQGRYFSRLSALANGVFANFLKIHVDEDDDSLLNQACEAFPEFSRHFLSSLKILRASANKETKE